MTDLELILLDEPAAGVNRTLLNELLDAVRKLRDSGKTVLLVEHDMKLVMGSARRSSSSTTARSWPRVPSASSRRTSE
jgi:ABC-type branched-subunit amino acid transport system ATPase component